MPSSGQKGLCRLVSRIVLPPTLTSHALPLLGMRSGPASDAATLGGGAFCRVTALGLGFGLLDCVALIRAAVRGADRPSPGDRCVRFATSLPGGGRDRGSFAGRRDRG